MGALTALLLAALPAAPRAAAALLLGGNGTLQCDAGDGWDMFRWRIPALTASARVFTTDALLRDSKAWTPQFIGGHARDLNATTRLIYMQFHSGGAPL
eukprot:gene25298-8636_t